MGVSNSSYCEYGNRYHNEACTSTDVYPGCSEEAIPHSLHLSFKVIQYPLWQYSKMYSIDFLDNKSNMSTSVKRPGDLPEPNDNPHPYTDFDELEIESYIATDEKKHKMFMEIENQIAEVNLGGDSDQ